MKTTLLTLLFLISGLYLSAEDTTQFKTTSYEYLAIQTNETNSKITKETFEILNETFKIIDTTYQFSNNYPLSLEVDGPVNILYSSSGTHNQIKISCDSIILKKINISHQTQNEKSIVKVNYKYDKDIQNIEKYFIPTIYLNTNNLTAININSFSNFLTSEPIIAKKLTVIASGASNVNIDGIIEELITKTDGVANVTYSGTAKKHAIITKGASNVIASKQINDTAFLTASGVSKIRIYVKNKIEQQICDSYASIVVLGKPESYTDKEVIISYRDIDNNRVYVSDTNRFKILGLDFTSIDNNVYEIGMGGYKLTNDRNQVKVVSRQGEKFNGHWGGIELGINGYNTQNFNMDFPKEDNYMNLRVAKSIAFHLNLFEFNIPFSKTSRQNWGMITGIGYEVNNYRFNNNVFLAHDSTNLKGFYIKGGNPVKSKLVVQYLTVPLLFEYQNKKFHIGMGGVFGLRLATHTKIKFQNPNDIIYLTDPETGLNVTTLHPGSKKSKQYNNYHMNPIKVDARFYIGYDVLNLFVEYSAIEMFRTNRGPQLYSWTIGITILGW